MKVVFATTNKGLEVILDLEPAWVSVGYGHAGRGMPVQATVAVGYDRSQLPIVKLVTEAMRAQKACPIIAVFEETVQIGFSLSPIEPQSMGLFQKIPFFGAFGKDIAGLHIGSAADFYPKDDAYGVFERCYQRDRTISLVIMGYAHVVGQEESHGIPLDVFAVSDLKREPQLLVSL